MSTGAHDPHFRHRLLADKRVPDRSTVLLQLTSSPIITTDNLPFCPPESRIFAESDVVTFYFMKTFRGLIFASDSVVPGLLVDYTVDNRIVSFDIQDASKRLPCHFWDTPDNLDGKPPWTVVRAYDSAADRLTEYFTRSTPDTELQATDDPRISVLKGFHGTWEGVVIHEAKETIAQPV